MTISEAKQLRIVDYLARLGHRPRSIKSDQYWYFSPLRDERTPSFKVNDRLNEWYDFGAATGGDLVELGKHLYRTDDVSEVLARERCPGTQSADGGYDPPACGMRDAGHKGRAVATPRATLLPAYPSD